MFAESAKYPYGHFSMHPDLKANMLLEHSRQVRDEVCSFNEQFVHPDSQYSHLGALKPAAGLVHIKKLLPSHYS